MFHDLRSAAPDTIIETDIAIIGAGAAGIAMGRELIGSRRDVLLIESGDLFPDADTLALNEGKVVGEPYPALETTRLRFFGGTTNHWDGHCRPLDAIDFEKRDWVPYSGWPITRADLEPFYARANTVCELGPYDYETETWRSGLPKLMNLDPARWEDRLWHYSPPTRFGERYRDELKAATNVTVLMNANVVEIVLNSAAKEVRELKLKTLDGKAATVRLKTCVLACGGIENPRLLLASNGVMKNGIGNANDLVGRFFMEHPHALIAYAIPLEADITPYRAYFGGVKASSEAGEAVIQSKPGLAEDFQRANRLRSATLDVGWGYDRSAGYLALRKAGKAIMDRQVPDDLGDTLLRMVRDIDGLASGLYSRLRKSDFFWFAPTIEQEPNPASRVTLDRERDAVGVPKPRLDWRLTRGDKDATRTTIRLLGEDMARAGIARMRIDEWLLENDGHWEELGIRYHQMGTTRMSDDPKTGVVDRNAKVHGVENLYITGSSIFPTSGYANPTLTIVALALRLCDHLREEGVAAAGRPT
jgi:choline dehydrogenase-like flavoprotein